MPETTDASAEPHVAVMAFPFASHPQHLLSVVRLLAAAEPRAYFSFFSTAQSNAFLFSGAGATSGGNIRPHDVTDGVPENHLFSGRADEAVDLFLTAAPAAIRGGVEAAVVQTGRRVSCVFSEAMLWFAGEVAAEMGVPWVTFWAAAPGALCAHVHTDAIRDKIGIGEEIAGREDEILEFIPGISRARVRDLPEGVVFGEMNSTLSAVFHKISLTLSRATAVCVNTFEELDPPLTKDLKSRLNKFLCVGPVNLREPASPCTPTYDPNGCIPWLESQAPSSVAYIGFGSLMMPPPGEIVAMAEALEASGVPFLWSLRDSEWAHLPQGFPTATTKGMVVPWAPQKEVLAHRAVGVFLTHCGWNSVVESVASGVPMICRPFLWDQRLDCLMVESAWAVGVGVKDGGFTKEGLVRDLELVLSSDEGKKMQMRIKELKDVAQKAVGPNGSSAENFTSLLEIVVGKTRGQ